MPDQKLLDYINQQLKNGVSEEGVKKALADVGWQQSFIDEAFSSIKQPNIAIPIPDAKIPAPSEPAAVKVEPAQPQPAQPQPVQGKPAQIQPAPMKPVAESRQEPDSALPFKVQPVPKTSVDADIFPKDNRLPAEKSAVPGQGEEKPRQPDLAKPEPGSVFSGEVPKVSELDKAFGQTFGVTQGMGDFEAGSPKKPFDPFAGEDKAILGTDEKKGAAGVIPNPLADGLPGAGPGSETGKAVKGGSVPGVADGSVPAGKAEKSGLKDPDGSSDGAGEKPKKKNFLVFLIFGIIGAVLLGGAAYGYFFYLEPSPALVFQKMAEKAGAVKTAEFSGKATLNVPPAPESGEAGSLDIGLDFTGVFDAANNEDLLSSITIGETDNLMSGSSAARFETISAGNAVYLKASGFSGPATTELVPYEGQWLKIDGLKVPREFDAVFPVYGKIREAAGIGDVDMTQLSRILMSANKPAVIKIKEKMGEETIAGTDCRRYSFEVDKEGLKAEIAASMAGAAAAETDNYNRIIDLAAISGEIWIGKPDYSLCKTTYSVSYESAGTVPAKTVIDVAIAKYNGGVSIQAPEQFRMGSEIFFEIAARKEGLVREAEALQEDNSRKNDMKMLFEAQKAWFLANKRFYTCSAAAGDCLGKPLNFPVSIGELLNSTPADPRNTGTVCGQDFVYCGLDNSKNPKGFCYYAKMSDGSFFTASPYGNFIRAAAPLTFKECQQGTLVE